VGGALPLYQANRNAPPTGRLNDGVFYTLIKSDLVFNFNFNFNFNIDPSKVIQI
jgi:hypothetical protein